MTITPRQAMRVWALAWRRTRRNHDLREATHYRDADRIDKLREAMAAANEMLRYWEAKDRVRTPALPLGDTETNANLDTPV